MKFDGDRLEELRRARKWDQHRLAEAARGHGTGVTQSQVSRYENGQEPSGRNAMALAAALEVDVRDLYTVDDEDDAEAAPVPFGASMPLDDYLRHRASQILDEEFEKRRQRDRAEAEA